VSLAVGRYDDSCFTATSVAHQPRGPERMVRAVRSVRLSRSTCKSIGSAPDLK
jgi:hypothetical protein